VLTRWIEKQQPHSGKLRATNRRDVLDAKELASMSLREKKQEKLKWHQYNNKTASKPKG
jgi:hypothetical protein